MPENREKITFWVSKEQKKKLKQYINLSPEDSITAFMISAIEFYGGFCMSSQKCGYLPLALSSAMQGTIKTSEDRISRLLFKNTVELSMLMNIISATTDVDADTLKKLRLKCMNEVKATNGKMTFEEINKYQKG
ncbi:hypothetical protein [uncultured Thomasclavelia sp.]|uniref:hypothetical protein n=1 Tax=uncultured Thomasclavelia sp. TaxID=3025759 RepID=UPI002599C2A6|nr:hypothetical protein [uncultured Thomasclavelia sp.]